MNNKDKKGGGVNPAPFKYMEIKNIEINIKFLQQLIKIYNEYYTIYFKIIGPICVTVPAPRVIIMSFSFTLLFI